MFRNAWLNEKKKEIDKKLIILSLSETSGQKQTS